MKKIIVKMLFAAVAAGLSLTSCDDMLETKNFSALTPLNFFKTEGDIDAAVTGIYRPLTTTWGGFFCADRSSTYAAAMITTDILHSNYVTAYEEFTVGPASGGTLSSSYGRIGLVARITDVINQVENCTGSTEAIRNRYVAELKTLRAFYMFALLDWFGPVNVKLDPATLMDKTIEPRPSLNEYVGYIEKDLSDAIETSSFPDKYNDDDGNWGRMSKSIAYGLRMKLYMHQKQWEKAKEAANKLMQMGFILLPDYEDVFNQSRNAELIWAVPSNTAFDNYFVSEMVPNNFKRGYNHEGQSYIRGTEASSMPGWGVFCMHWEFYDTFADSDVRKKCILSEYDTTDGRRLTRENGMKGALPIKFTDSQKKEYGIQKAHPVIRYADVLLSYAEAENELNGPTQSAVAAVKQVTDRAGIEIPASATTGKEAFRSFLLEERGRELFCEGHRRQDLIRHGVYINRAVERGFNAKPHQVLYPIPESVIIEADGIIEQNPGYTAN